MQNSEKSDQKIIGNMADAMLRFGEGCTKEQLGTHFTTDEIEKYNERARMLANDRAVKLRRARAA